MGLIIHLLPGATEGCWDLGEDIRQRKVTCFGIFKALTKAIWFLPDTAIKLFKVIINPDDNTKSIAVW